MKTIISRLAVAIALSSFVLHAQEVANPNPQLNRLASMSIEQLMEIPVTVVARKEQPLADTAAAVHVITQEDIRRSGAVALPEVLRLAPGMQVARINAGNWAVSARGFNGRYSNKLLVMIDGMPVYTPFFSGVYWDSQTPMMEEIDRIEVVRGPGGAVWGANAVNGVINIVTKKAKDSEGGLISASVGTEVQGAFRARYGGKISDEAFYKFHFQYQNHDRYRRDPLRPNKSDYWTSYRGGGRVDWFPDEQSELSLISELYHSKASDALPLDSVGEWDGGYLIGRWGRELSGDSDISVQLSFDRNVSDYATIDQRQQNLIIDARHQYSGCDRHEFNWGMEYRLSSDKMEGTPLITMTVPERSLQRFGFFAQDEIQLVRDRLSLTLGTKFEHNDFTGFEW